MGDNLDFTVEQRRQLHDFIIQVLYEQGILVVEPKPESKRRPISAEEILTIQPHLANGLKNKQIAEKTGIDEARVAKIKAKIRAKALQNPPTA